MHAEPGLLQQLVGFVWAIALGLALAVVCRFLPGATGDRSGGVAVDPSLRDQDRR